MLTKQLSTPSPLQLEIHNCMSLYAKYAAATIHRVILNG